MGFSDVRTLAALGPDLPCGEDLEYDPLFLALEQASQAKSEQQFGSTIIPAEPADWLETERLAQQLLEKTLDVRVLVYLTQAGSELRGLPGYAQGITLIADALENYWIDIHPQLDIDGEHDPLPRMNALASLGAMEGCGRSLRSASLLNGMHGRLTLRDAEAVLEGSRSADQLYPPGREHLMETLRQGWAQHMPELMAVADIHSGLGRIQELVRTRLGEEWVPDFTDILRNTQLVTRTWSDSAVVSAPMDDSPPADADSPAATPQAATLASAPALATPAPQRWQDARINSRDDAMAMLAKVSAYFEMHEPSHPAPFLIRRTQQLIAMNFHDILRNLAPQGLEQFETWLPRDTSDDNNHAGA